MSEALIAKRYAKALFSLSLEAKTMASTHQDMTAIDIVCKDNPDFVRALKNPVMSQSEKQQLVQKAFTGSLTETTLRFLNFLVEKKRIDLISETAKAFLFMEEEHRGVAEARFTTAQPADKEILDILDKGLSDKYSKKFLIKTESDPAIIGGFLLQIKDKIYDFSLRNQIKLLREQLLGAGAH